MDGNGKDCLIYFFTFNVATTIARIKTWLAKSVFFAVIGPLPKSFDSCSRSTYYTYLYIGDREVVSVSQPLASKIKINH